MSFFASLAIFSVVALVAWNAWTYYHATGSVAERLSATWKGSLTIFVGAWGAILSVFVGGCDFLAQVTGDPQFNSLAEAVKGVIPPTYHPYIPIATIGAMMLARLRTAGK